MAIPATATRFTVPVGRFVVISAHGLTTNDTLQVYRRACEEQRCPGDGSDLWVPMVMCRRRFGLSVVNTVLCVDLPGEYYLDWVGLVNQDVTVCVDNALEGACPGCGCAG